MARSRDWFIEMKKDTTTVPSADSKATSNGQAKKKSAVSQTDVPSMTLDDALRIPRAIVDYYASKPTAPLDVAAAISMQPASGPFRMMCSAANAYGLTDGGAYAETISLTSLGKRILKPTVEGDDVAARREAILTPSVIKGFLTHYDNSPLPGLAIGRNVLEARFNIPSDRSEDVYNTITTLAESGQFITRIKNSVYINLRSTHTVAKTQAEEPISQEEDAYATVHDELDQLTVPAGSSVIDTSRSKRVYITHGKNKAFIDPLKKLLAFGELEPVVSIEKGTASTPVPQKVLNDLRSCGAAIIHVDSEETLIDKEGKEKIVINPNVLIEIGAAMALFGERYILLVEEGVSLPSNLQGLFEVRYSGADLGSKNTIELLQAIADMKGRPLPT